ncbi:MAG: ParA family protein [Undibacterium sp.]|uniref:ParA family protein n=1 Tax=Undibacterium sp. TaxID=1914977 RepID=UPI00271F8DD3|nr:ParA family protein [Undibacterium sp.]MDO8652222.1 ParA family protein [Undibacterium sp.]
MKPATLGPVRVIAVCNRKGGAGKTTTSVNLAAELAALGWRVLLVDLDSQGHCAVGLGVKVKIGEPTVHDIFTNPQARLIDAVRETVFANLALAPADQLFEHGSGLRDERRLACALADDEIATRFDVVILDTPPSLDFLLFNALSAANWVLIPYVPHPLSFEGVRQLMRVLFKVMSNLNPGLKVLGFLPMTAAEHIRQHRSVTSEVSRQFGAHRVLNGIRNDIRLAEAFGAGKPVRYYASSSRGAQDFATLAASLAPLLGVRRDDTAQID